MAALILCPVSYFSFDFSFEPFYLIPLITEHKVFYSLAKNLDDNPRKRLTDFGVGEGSTLFLLCRLRGGKLPEVPDRNPEDVELTEVMQQEKGGLTPLTNWVTLTKHECGILNLDPDPDQNACQIALWSCHKYVLTFTLTEGMRLCFHLAYLKISIAVMISFLELTKINEDGHLVEH